MLRMFPYYVSSPAFTLKRVFGMSAFVAISILRMNLKRRAKSGVRSGNAFLRQNTPRSHFLSSAKMRSGTFPLCTGRQKKSSNQFAISCKINFKSGSLGISHVSLSSILASLVLFFAVMQPSYFFLPLDSGCILHKMRVRYFCSFGKKCISHVRRQTVN